MRGCLNKSKDTVMAKIALSMEACRMMHPAAHPSNQSFPEGQDNMDPDRDTQANEGY